MPFGLHPSSGHQRCQQSARRVAQSSASSHLPNLIDVDVPVRRACKQRVAVGAPSQGDAPWNATLRRHCGAQLVKDVLVLQIPHLDRSVRGSTQPVVLGTETECVDRAPRIEGVQVLSVVHVPKHGSAIFAARGA
eukprot:CAMPEP_0179044872 /NCGR_PEP_ID=MMETSP0796-20121207/17891_1 /TAXON_ID=73915 /ORGANISM="Pyrodinium bahamense, Strain pbaha01" /LENGTH=134 /DNA_ID=CAMNT_0020741271 /DNA_START=53 /DNA_END=457 /DNA_ORIENTATION=-